MKNQCIRFKDRKRRGNSLMQCLQTQQLDLIPLSPKLLRFNRFNIHFGAAFCHVHNQLWLWEGTEKVRTQPSTAGFADFPQNCHQPFQSISEGTLHGATQRQSRLSASCRFSLVLVRNKSLFPIPTTSCSTSPGDTFTDCITTPAGMQSIPGSPHHSDRTFFSFEFCSSELQKTVEVTFQIYFPACFHAGGGCVCAQRKHCVWLHIP